jgi:hypothetical protein
MTNPNPVAPLGAALRRAWELSGRPDPFNNAATDLGEARRAELWEAFGLVADAVLAARATSTPAGLDVDLLARALRVVTRGSWSTPARRDPERQKRQDEAWLTRTAGAIAREYVALQGADR